MPWACNGALSGLAYSSTRMDFRLAAPGSILPLRRRRASTCSRLSLPRLAGY